MELKDIPEDEKKYFEKCRVCGEWMDLRKPEEVIKHANHPYSK